MRNIWLVGFLLILGIGIVQCQDNWDQFLPAEKKAISNDVKEQILPVFLLAFAVSLVIQFLSSLPLVTGFGSGIIIIGVFRTFKRSNYKKEKFF